MSANKAPSGICAGILNIFGDVESNEKTRTTKDQYALFHSYQPPDKAKIVGAETVVQMDNFFQKK
jgi:hypothetical protein